MRLGYLVLMTAAIGCGGVGGRQAPPVGPAASAPAALPPLQVAPRTGGASRELPAAWSLPRSGEEAAWLATGERAWDAGDVRGALLEFERVIAHAPTSGAADAARWYLGHIYTYVDVQPEKAAQHYLDIVAAHPTGYESRKAHLAAAASLTEGRLWPQAGQILTDILARQDFSFEQRLEALSRRGYVQLSLGALDAAEADLAAAVSEWQRAPRIDDPYFVAMAHFYRGDVQRQRFRDVALRQPLADLKVDLDAKRRLLTQAYDAYKEALAFRTPYWGTAAGFAMADLFFEYHQIATSAPPPAELSAQDQQLYLDEVAVLVADNLIKARDGHRKNVELAKAYGVETEWSRASALRAGQLDVAISSQARPRP